MMRIVVSILEGHYRHGLIRAWLYVSDKCVCVVQRSGDIIETVEDLLEYYERRVA